ncbi:hypothetical protein R3W88_001206 [Solanum pinnatisectum]|uniref:Uncharacterized protein n=1 Tax=Solanum pinnatisectum TaxID=50273 RepID=A0AAV9MKG5_9SOLN|nr:hypothetical protein R3W88_001206 [Solanum pinnatisectum]
MTLKTAIPGGKIASKLFDELSHSSFNFGESKKSTDSSNSTKVNSLMVNATNMDEKFTMMEQTIEALKSIDEKNLQIANLIGKLDLYNSGESHHILTTQEKVDIDSLARPIDSQSAKHSTLMATLIVQQLQDMIINTIKDQYGGSPQSSLGYSKPERSSLMMLRQLKKTTNTSKVDDFSNEESSDTWTLIALKRQKHQGTSKLRLSKLDTKSSTNQLQQCESIKSNTKSKYINTSSPKVRWTITLMEFFLETLLDI